eukprot:g18570.t1
MGNRLPISGCPHRKSEAELREEIRVQIEFEHKEKERVEREATAAKRKEAAEKAAREARERKEAADKAKKDAEASEADAKAKAEAKLMEDEHFKKLLGDILIPHNHRLENAHLRINDLEDVASKIPRVQERMGEIAEWFDSNSKLAYEKVMTDLGQQEQSMRDYMAKSFVDLDVKTDGIEQKLTELDSAVAVLGAAMGDAAKIRDLPEGDISAALTAIGVKFSTTKAELDANYEQATKFVEEVKADLETIREISSHRRTMFDELQSKIDIERAELSTTLDTERVIALENQEELRKSLNVVVSAMKELEDRMYFLENQDDEICSECSSVEPTTTTRKGKLLLSPVPEGDAGPRSSAAGASEFSLAEQIAKGERIPRMKHDERIDMIDWAKLRIIEPRISETSKTTKWGDLYIATLTKPPLRQDFAWRVWKESVWHWSVSLRLVGASFTKMGQQIIAQSFRRNQTTGEIFEGEHSVATAAGQSRDLVEIMGALDQHFCPHTRSVQSALESEVHLIRRPDMQSPMLFLHLLGIIYRREVEINDSTNVRTEKAKVDRALKALFLQKPTEQLIRSSISRATVDRPYTYSSLQSEVDSLNITDFKRYKPNAAGADVHYPKDRDEVDHMQKLLEQIGERLSVDSHGQHAMTNSYFHQTARSVSTRGGAGTGLWTLGGGGGSSGGADNDGFLTPTSTISQQNVLALQNLLGQAAANGGKNGGGSLLMTPGAQAAPNNSSADGETKKDSNGKEFWVPAKLSQEEQAKRIEASNRFKLKKEPNANWCKFGEFCNDVLTTGKCQGKHTKKEFWRMITQFERKYPEKAKQLAKEKAEKKAKENKQ